MIFITKSASTRIESRVFEELSLLVAKRDIYHKIYFHNEKSKYINFLTIFFKSDLIIVHSALFLSFHYIILGKLFKKKIIGFVWDKYPVIIFGLRYDRRLVRKFVDFIEEISLRFCDEIIVCNSDFVDDGILKNSHLLNFWPPVVIPLIEDPSYASEIRIIFSGQINKTRDLESAFFRLNELCRVPFTLFVASTDSLPSTLLGYESVKHIGFLPKNELSIFVQSCHFGLISLSKGFEGPGFPSKTFDYLSAGRPCLYYGPRLSEYISIIMESGVGYDLDSLDSISIETFSELNKNFLGKVHAFNKRVCLTDEVVDDFLKISIKAVCC